MYLLKTLLLGWITVPLVSSRILSHRKSLKFEPYLRHATFVTSPSHNLISLLPDTVTASSDPFTVAREFMEILMKDLDESRMSYEIRNDSYTDARTGVTHVYVKQLVDGLEVSNGIINLNILNGKVDSYGNSFFHGNVSAASLSSFSMYASYCNMLSKRLQEKMEIDLQEIHGANCRFLSRKIMTTKSKPEDPRPAVLMFMIAAIPSSSSADELSSDFNQYLSKISTRSLNSSGNDYELENVPGAIDVVPIHKAYIQVDDGNSNYLKAVWKFEVRMEENWYEVVTDFFDPRNIISVIDWASDGWSGPSASISPAPELATYLAYYWSVNNPTEGERVLQKESMDPQSSPFGWHKMRMLDVPPELMNEGFRDPLSPDLFQMTSTVGNNIFAQTDWEGGDSWKTYPRPNPGLTLMFNYTYNPTISVTHNARDLLSTARNFSFASITQIFYTMNSNHDFSYLYGFDEASGNFQQHNFDRGGKGGDPVVVYGQYGHGFNSAYFITPPDGRSPVCNMFLWDTAFPYRDGDFETALSIHEYTHGMSIRLTGGPDNSGCLTWAESGGMGEGWGDFFAIMTHNKEGMNASYAIAPWVSNNPNGLRRYPYSVNVTINPLTYKSADNYLLVQAHDIGSVWAEILWVVAFELVKVHGFNEDPFPPKPDDNGMLPLNDFYRPANNASVPLIPQHGNTLMIQLVMNAMKLQPCKLTFIIGRDAIIKADEILTKGENFCTLWKGFAERGLGVNARITMHTSGWSRREDYSVPAKCLVTKSKALRHDA